MNQDLILAHDVGTGGTKSVLVAMDGTLRGVATGGYETAHPRPGWAEQDPEDWWAAVCAGTRALLEAGTPPERIAGLAFTGQMLGIVPVDRGGRTLHPAIIWSDSRAHEEARRLMRRFLGPGPFTLVAAATASGLDAVPKLHWLRTNEPELYRDTDMFLDVVGYLTRRCAGAPAMDWTAASATGLLDLRRKRWNRLLARLVSAPLSKLPPLRRPGAMAGPLLPGPAGALGLLPGTPVIIGAGDAPCAAVGAGATREGDGHVVLGTSGWVGITVLRPQRGRHGIATMQSADPEHCLLIAETQSAGACRAWAAAALFGAEGRADPTLQRAIDDAIDGAPPGADGLLFAPWLSGERTPVRDVHVRAAFLNLDARHGRNHLVRAVHEGVALNLRWILEILRDDFGHAPAALRLVGGGSASDAWAQIVADVTGRRIERVAAAREAVAVGAALVAARGLGTHERLGPASVRVERTFVPRDDLRPVYDQLFATFRRTYRALRPLRSAGRGRAGDAR